MLSTSAVSSGLDSRDHGCTFANRSRCYQANTQAPDGKRPAITYELEVEILDVPALISEGEKEERGEPNRFDEMLQSVLDTVRMIIRNVG
jgi:hypothetical protein